MELVGELVGLRAQGVEVAPRARELARQTLDLCLVAERGDGTDELTPHVDRHAIDHHHTATGCQQQLVLRRLASLDHRRQARSGHDVTDGVAGGAVLQIEQAARLVVDHVDHTLTVDGDHSFANAPQHRVALLQAGGDLAGLQTEDLTPDVAGQQPRDPAADD